MTLTGVATLGEVVQNVQLTLLSGTTSVTNTATWQSSNTAIATVTFGLVRATGPGTAFDLGDVSAADRGGASARSARDQDCAPYDFAHLALFQETSDASAVVGGDGVRHWSRNGLAGRCGQHRGRKQPAGGVSTGTPSSVSSWAREHAAESPAIHRDAFHKGVSGQQTTIAPKDCKSATTPSALQAVSQGSNVVER